MVVQRQSYQSGHTPKCLVVVDDSAEWDRAVRYAGRWATRAGGRIVTLHVIETEDQNQQWLGVADLMRAEAQEDANAALDQAATLLFAIGAMAPERVVREGDPTTQILATIEHDSDIALLVLAANSGADGPGPLVTHVTKTIGAFPIPLVIVPGDLADADIDALS
ncbi:universal stress protein [Bradyrhizobium ontarionense]|uniref:Universal stress protein n=1 Tax=Bradyrhizobium ontarionense TaxID=2898149 RepID=A0ABY3R4M3_9BRAD|nr:universal stress protein [Bradyrhizobium sp. A19]UFZ02255.1 universal stress protein [Bradyrhizobium sp. A19]